MHRNANEVAATILEQMGGARRLRAMIGAQFSIFPSGVGIRFPNKNPSKGNYVEVIYQRGPDSYDVTFYNCPTPMVKGGLPMVPPPKVKGKVVKQLDDIYSDSLIEIFEHQTGWYLRMGSTKQASGVFVAVRELPQIVQHVLKELTYHRPTIKVDPATSYQLSFPAGEGYQGFVAAVNLRTNQYKIEKGSWGGANPWSPRNPVDLDTTKRALPPDSIIISGERGGSHPTYAHIEAHPDNIPKLLPQASETALSPQELVALNIIGGIKGGYRDEYFHSKGLGKYSIQNPLIQSLITSKT